MRSHKLGNVRSYVKGPVFLLAGILTIAAGCKKEQAAAPPRRAVPVSVDKVVQKTMPVVVTAIGNAEAYATISIRAQVSGELLDVHFKEGDFVQKGQKLFSIDPRPYEAALEQAKATLARDKAVAENSHVQAQRYKQLFDAGIGTREQADSFASSADAGDATVRADEAAIKTAALDLEYCTINSPIDGRTGAVMVKPGNLIKANDVPIVVINQVNPIYVNFTVPQQYLPDVKKHMEQGTLQVSATIPGAVAASEQGTLTFVDNSVDVTTGTIHLRATFGNKDNQLWPGLFVNTLVTLAQQAGATVVPAQAISTSQSGTFVYVVKSDNTVEARPVVSNRTVDGNAVIEKGLSPGETIVTEGQMQLVPGAKVEIKNAQSAADAAGDSRQASTTDSVPEQRGAQP